MRTLEELLFVLGNFLEEYRCLAGTFSRRVCCGVAHYRKSALKPALKRKHAARHSVVHEPGRVLCNSPERTGEERRKYPLYQGKERVEERAYFGPHFAEDDLARRHLVAFCRKEAYYADHRKYERSREKSH